MKDKYEKCFYENEGKNTTKEKIKLDLLKLKFYLQILNKSGFKDLKVVSGMNIRCIVITLGMVGDYYQEWIKSNIINKIDRQALMLAYINSLNYFLSTEKYKEVDNVMNSFKKSGIINDIKLSENKKMFQIQTLGDKTVKFAPEFNNKKDIELFNTHCHGVTEVLCKKHDNVYATTVIMKNYFDKHYYHSFIVKDGVVHDFAQNIVMSFENYKQLFGCKVIMNIDGKLLLENIEQLNKSNEEFKKNEMCNILKYAIHTQIERKYS